jgi:hypothetical protein
MKKEVRGKKGWLKICSAMMVFLLFASMIPASAFEISKVREMYNKDRARLKHHFGIVINEDTFDEAKEWLLASGNLAVASLVSIREKIENSSVEYDEKELLIDEINGHITDVSAVIEQIENAKTVEELREAAKDLKVQWLEAKVSLKKTLALKWIFIMEKMTENAERIAQKVEELIEEYRMQGKDTTPLERWLEKFNEDRLKAEEKLAMAKERVMNIETNIEANRFLIRESEALKHAAMYMKESQFKLRKIIKLLNNYETGSADVEGSGFLQAIGEGVIEIEGSGTVIMRGNGSVTVSPEESVIAAIGFGEKKINEDGSVTYTGEGKVIVRGENISVYAEGSMRLNAKGVGTAHLEGTGVYKVHGFEVNSVGFEAIEVDESINA